jgi:hypothetical protein
MRAILPLAFLAVAACYTPRAVEPAPDPWNTPPGGWGAAPLEASLFYDEYTGYAYFDLSRPAHVAMFALRPGGGMEMIYPAIGVGSRMAFDDGRSIVRTGSRVFGHGRNIVRTTGSPYRLTGNWSMAFGQGPMYILLVASDEPLDVGSFRATGTMAWLNRTSVTYNPYVALDALVGEIVPRPTTSAWTTAMHVVWPFNAWPDVRQRTRYVRVVCASGVQVVVPTEALLMGYPVCPEDLKEEGEPETPPEKGEKTKIAVVPERGGDAPVDWMVASIGDLDLERELDRLRKVHGRPDFGDLEIRPFPAFPSDERARRWGHRGADEPGARSRRSIDSPDVDRTRARPASPAPSPSARPAPTSRPAPPAKPSKPKPTKPGGSGGS